MRYAGTAAKRDLRQSSAKTPVHFPHREMYEGCGSDELLHCNRMNVSSATSIHGRLIVRPCFLVETGVAYLIFPHYSMDANADLFLNAINANLIKTWDT